MIPQSQRVRRYSDLTRHRVIEFRLRGTMTHVEIAQEMKIDIRTVDRIIADGIAANQVPRRLKPPLSEWERQRATELLDDGASYGEVARTLDRSVTVIMKTFPNRGWGREELNLWRSLRKLRKQVFGDEEEA